MTDTCYAVWQIYLCDIVVIVKCTTIIIPTINRRHSLSIIFPWDNNNPRGCCGINLFYIVCCITTVKRERQFLWCCSFCVKSNCFKIVCSCTLNCRWRIDCFTMLNTMNKLWITKISITIRITKWCRCFIKGIVTFIKCRNCFETSINIICNITVVNLCIVVHYCTVRTYCYIRGQFTAVFNIDRCRLFCCISSDHASIKLKNSPCLNIDCSSISCLVECKCSSVDYQVPSVCNIESSSICRCMGFYCPT